MISPGGEGGPLVGENKTGILVTTRMAETSDGWAVDVRFSAPGKSDFFNQIRVGSA